MRKRRSKLEVSTFPFLAVLLCIMGSLMLLLFIMDRRAKIAARHRSDEELQVRQKRTKAEEDARQAEWEKARQQLHASLLRQEDQLLAASKGLQHNLSDAGGKLALTQARHTGLQEKVKDESARIGALLLDIEGQRAGLQQAGKMETMTKAELLAAARELAELERAFLQLRALKDREKQAYSVVPYRGKRGDMRPPIYIECVRDGVIFHPDRKPLQAWDFAPAAVRSEVERRFGPLAAQKAAADKDTIKGPYVLFLIRPAGIGSYYAAQSALKGLNLDFGYELVDEGWALDFGGDTYAKNAPSSRPQVPWQGSDEPRAMIGGPLPGRGNIGPPLFANQPPKGLAGGSPGFGAGNGNAGVADLPPGGSGVGGTLPAPPSGGIGLGSTLPAPPLGGSGVVGSLPAPLSGGSGVGGSLPAPPPSGGNPSNSGVDAGNPAKSPAFVPIAKSTPVGPSQGVSAINTPIPGNSVGGQSPKASTPGGGEPGESEGKIFPSYGGGEPRKKPTPAPPLSKLLGNKDFVITIDCRSDAVTITPSGLIYRWTASNKSETDAALAQTVTNLIARRQASVRPGEPPYRPLICFRVSSDGLRTYLRVYPLLERLSVPMTRENVVE